jgi:hypothetical protein
MSVVPAGSVGVELVGPAAGEQLISTKLLKLKAKALISSGVSGLRISGSVMRGS